MDYKKGGWGIEITNAVRSERPYTNIPKPQINNYIQLHIIFRYNQQLYPITYKIQI
jgi:hypothetical protein